MPGLINGLFGDPAAQTAQAQQNAQNNAQQFNLQMFQQMMAQQQAAKQQALQAFQSFMQQNPNPATLWGSIVGPQSTAPGTVGGTQLGANGMPVQGQTANTPALGGDPNTFRILAQLLGQQTKPSAPPFQLAPPSAPATKSPAASPGAGPNMPHLPPSARLARFETM